MDKLDMMLLILLTFVTILITLLILDIRRDLIALGYWQDYTAWEKISGSILFLFQLTTEPYDKIIVRKPKKHIEEGDEN